MSPESSTDSVADALIEVKAIPDVSAIENVSAITDVSAIADLRDAAAEMEAVRAGSYTGRDPDNLVTATIDGTGLVTRIRFAGTVGMRAPQIVEAATLAAVAAARANLDEAWAALVGDAPTPDAASGAAGGGGLDLAYEQPGEPR